MSKKTICRVMDRGRAKARDDGDVSDKAGVPDDWNTCKGRTNYCWFDPPNVRCLRSGLS